MGSKILAYIYKFLAWEIIWVVALGLGVLFCPPPVPITRPEVFKAIAFGVAPFACWFLLDLIPRLLGIEV